MRRTLHTLPAAAALAVGMGFSASSFAEDKVVTLWHTEPNPRTVAVMKDMIERYEAMNPGIRIKQEPIAWGSLDTKLQAALAAGAPPDASHGQAYVERSLSAKGLLLPINEVIDSIGADDLYDVVKKAQLPRRRQVLRPRPRARHRPHRLPQGLLPRGGPRSGEAGRDLGRMARAPEGAHRGHRRRRQERPLRPRPRRPRLLHQRRGLHVDRLQRRAALRGEPPPDVHREAGARNARVLEGARGLLPRAGLAEPRLPRHLRHARDRQGRQHLRLGPRHRLLREVRAGGGRTRGHRHLPLEAGGSERTGVPHPARLRAVDGVQGREAPAGSHRLPQVLLPAPRTTARTSSPCPSTSSRSRSRCRRTRSTSRPRRS